MASVEKKFYKLAEAFRTALAQGNYAQGREVARQALKLAPGNPSLLADYALCLMRTGDYEQSRKTYMQLLRRTGEENMPGTALDGLVEVCGWLGDKAQVRRYGNMSLTQADNKFRQFHAYPLPDSPPPAFDPSVAERNLIVFSLYGARPRYCETAVMNVGVARDLFPQWRCRFYLDDTVPAGVQARLSAAGAQVVKVSDDIRQTIPPQMWRFLVMEDEGVSRFQVRDADALLSERDKAAVEAWLQSGYWYHHMRDYFTHTELLLAGMWAGCHNPVLPGIRTLIAQYLSEEEAHKRFADQYFLRRSLWPTIRQSLLSHDDMFGFLDAEPFPPHEPVRWLPHQFHVGSNVSYKRVSSNSDAADGAEQLWALLDEQGTELCRYSSPVKGGQWEEWLPFFLTDGIQSGIYRVKNVIE